MFPKWHSNLSVFRFDFDSHDSVSFELVVNRLVK
jgi:hypothetical protein